MADPKRCLECAAIIAPRINQRLSEVLRQIFCSKPCAGLYNNRQRAPHIIRQTPEQRKAYNRQYMRQWSHKHRDAINEKRRKQNRPYGEAIREYRAKNRRRLTNQDRSRKYGITPQQFQNLLSSQNYRCAGCQAEDPGKRGWHVDHDHATKLIRGILCYHCNIALGHLRDNANTTRRLAEYLDAAIHMRERVTPATMEIAACQEIEHGDATKLSVTKSAAFLRTGINTITT